jgi:hypothetical protein
MQDEHATDLPPITAAQWRQSAAQTRCSDAVHIRVELLVVTERMLEMFKSSGSRQTGARKDKTGSDDGRGAH